MPACALLQDVGKEDDLPWFAESYFGGSDRVNKAAKYVSQDYHVSHAMCAWRQRCLAPPAAAPHPWCLSP
jgi:hypothetical protein